MLACQFEKRESKERSTFRRCDDDRQLECTKCSASADASIWEGKLNGTKRMLNLPNNRTVKVLQTENAMTANCLDVSHSAQVLTCQYDKSWLESKGRTTFQPIAWAKYSQLKMRRQQSAWMSKTQDKCYCVSMKKKHMLGSKEMIKHVCSVGSRLLVVCLLQIKSHTTC